VTDQTTFILLGRTGDIISLLPCLKAEADSGHRPALMVSKQYASVLEGVSYVDPVIFSGKWDDLAAAHAEAKARGPVVCCQVAGPKEAVEELTYTPTGYNHSQCDAFDKEIWRCAGHVENIMALHPLVFDRRNAEREADLCKQLPKGKKIILAALGGNSSPFPGKRLLLELLKLKFGRGAYAVVDLSEIKAVRVFDLLGLYEKAHILVAADSAPLHLAWATPGLPVVALTSDTPTLWHGTSWRPNHALYMRYGDFPVNGLDILSSIQNAKPFVPQTETRISSAYESFEGDPGGIPAKTFGRDTVEILKDDRRMPYLRDVMRVACQKTTSDGWVYLTKPGVVMEGYPKELGWGHREIFKDGTRTHHPAIDLFAMPREWWLSHRNAIPDFVLGNDLHWQHALAKIMEMEGGKELKDIVWCPPPPPGKGYPKPPARVSHNESLAKDWAHGHSVTIGMKRVSEQIEMAPFHRNKIFPGAYNSSIIEYKGRKLLAYRYHPAMAELSRIAMAELDGNWDVMRNEDISMHTGSVEDPRLFTFAGDLWLSYVASNYPAEMKSIIRFGRLTEGPPWTMHTAITPKFGNNDGLHIEKNWVFFDFKSLESGYSIYAIHHSQPEQMVIRLSGHNVTEEHTSKSPQWKYGEIKGGTLPIEYEGKWLRFFHSTLDNEPIPQWRRYYVGAMLMDNKPPFAPVSISREPVIIGSESDDLTTTERSQIPFYKPKVVFPCGAIYDGSNFFLSVGINDGQLSICKVTPERLNL
jgi:predicted GH43/DUF377 family glycosyl hydrolase